MENEILLALHNLVTLVPNTWVLARDRALLILMYATGARISEALGITKEDILEDSVRVLGKGNKERLIPLLPIVKNVFDSYLHYLPFIIKKNERIFIGEKGKPLQRAIIARRLLILRRLSGLPEHLSAHAFRHSFATHLLKNGADLRSIQELLGHKNLSSTQRYTNIDIAQLNNIYYSTHPLAKK